MPWFRYAATGVRGGIRRGTLEARTRAEAVKILGEWGLLALELEPVPAPPAPAELLEGEAPLPVGDRPRGPSGPVAPAVARAPEARRPPVPRTDPGRPAAQTLPRVSPAAWPPRWSGLERALFLRQLAGMLASGVPLQGALRTLAVTARGRPAQALDDIVRLVERGERLSAAMEHSRLFTGLQCGMVAIGEEICFLHQVLERLASLAEGEQVAARRLGAALTYPAVVLAAMGLMVLFLGQLLAGPLAQVASSLGGGAVPLLALAQAAGNPLALLAVPLGAVVGTGWLGRAWSVPSRRQALEGWLLRWPLVGPLLREVETARLARLLASMAATGLTLDRALQLAGLGTASPAARQALEEAHRRVLEGESLARALGASGYFPGHLVHLVAAGERAGRLPEILARAADYAEFHLQAALDTAAAALEPLLVGILGVGVGLVLLLVFAPIYQAIGQL